VRRGGILHWRLNAKIIATGGVLLGLFGAIAIYGIFVEPDWIEVRHMQVPIKGLPQALSGKTAIHLSDLHIHSMGRKEKRILEIVRSIDPDMIFLTGDYVPWNGDVAPAMTFLSRLQASSGIWAVMGEYDYSNSRQSCLFCHAPDSGLPTQAHQARFLRNAAAAIDFGDGSVMVAGIDREWVHAFDEGYELLAEPTGMILLSHTPLTFDLLDRGRDVLVLAGDTHGGQIPLPGWLWRLVGYEKNARYNMGWFHQGDNRMYVSKGVGTSHWRIRILRRPEIVVLRFY
jgi:uncharacterized protein